MDNRICFKRRPRPLFLRILTAHVIPITTFRHVIHAVHELKKKIITSKALGFVNFTRKFQFSIFVFDQKVENRSCGTRLNVDAVGVG